MDGSRENGRYLRMQEISKEYPGVHALKKVSIEADAGEIVALLGENGAGKSTLMNVLGGVVRRDGGTVYVDGAACHLRCVADAQRLGIAFIHQELSLFKQLSVRENLFMEHLPTRKGTPFLDRRRMQQQAMEVFRTFGMELSPDTQVSKLTMGQQQIVEIAAAVLRNAKIIILDEPSTSLTMQDRERLYTIMRQLRQEQRVVLYITHDIENALALSDRFYVLRDGFNAGDGVSSAFTKEEVIRMMIGSKAGKLFCKSPRQISEQTVLELQNISTETKLHNVSLHLQRGEVLGLYGLIGAGRTELIRAMYGLDPITAGTITVNGVRVDRPSPRRMKELGVGYLTENRRDEGLFLELGIDQNLTLTKLKKIQGRLGILSRAKERQITQEVIRTLQIATPSPSQMAGKLSGGNQQKVVIGKWLHLAPQIFILDEPTKGIDVGAKSEIYRLIDEIAKSGVSVLLISSEIEEIMGICDRVNVMAHGTLVADLAGAAIEQEEIIRYTMS